MARTLAANVSITIKEKGKAAPNYKLEDDITADFTFQDLSNYVKLSLVTIAKETLKEEQANGFDKDPVVVVDNKFTKDINAVQPFGKIQYVSRKSIKDVIDFAYRAVVERSKVVTGNYKNHHWLFFNGNLVGKSFYEVRSWLESNPTIENRDVVRIVNVTPYARKLETLGVSRNTPGKGNPKTATRKKKKSKVTVSVPNGAYALAEVAIRRKYGKNIFIAFRYLTATQIGLSGSFKKGSAKQIGRPYLYPSILLSVVAAGVT